MIILPPLPTVVRLCATPTVAAVVININSIAYVPYPVLTYFARFNELNFSQYRLCANGAATEAIGLTMQLATLAAPATPIHTGGNDLAITNVSGFFDSGWLSRDDGATGTKNYCVCMKGGNVTVDFNCLYVELHMR